MPKRAPTPETGDDEPIYFSVVNPWPQNANMEVYGDLRLCVQWLVEALGDPNLLMAVFHKPSSPRLIIIEVNRKYGTKEYKESAEYRRILGKHSWVGPQGILENPPVGISGVNYSSIFYSCYNTGRKVEKNGWKRKWVEDDMFGTPSQRREIFKHPYPLTSFVDAPTQDQTSLQYCLNLPASEFDKNERVVKQIIATAPVGSSTWTALRGSQLPKKSQLAESDVNQIDDADVPDETTNLWAQAKDKPPIPIMSDLPMMSSAGGDGICPHHGVLCRKMCDWRTEYDRKQGPKSGGPSNIKNYNSRSYKPGPRSPPPKTEATSRIPGDSNGNLGPKGPARAPPPPLHIMQNRGIGRGASPTSPSTSSSNSFSTTSPIVSSPQYGSVGSHQAPAAVRGAPAWASRGRGRGRGGSS